MRLRPHPIARFGALIPAALLTFGTVQVWTPEYTSEFKAALLAIMGIAVYLTVRWIVLSGVVLGNDAVVIHGACWSRRVPVGQAIEVQKSGVCPALKWRAEGNQSRSSPILAFMTTPSDPIWFKKYNDSAVAKVNSWINKGGKLSPKSHRLGT